ncbi:UDP-N-acetylmuramate--alanine ligase [Leuconostoc miyukkimchii]|nr:UDP-N-acetylmuramate--alanine ligase [Leuconostoc miyukkimchii]
MLVQDKLKNKPRIYRMLNDENTKYKNLIFELRKGELQYFTFINEGK